MIPILDMTADTVTHAFISGWIYGFGVLSSVAGPHTLTVLLEYIDLFQLQWQYKNINFGTYPWPYTTLCLSLAKLRFAPSNYV